LGHKSSANFGIRFWRLPSFKLKPTGCLPKVYLAEVVRRGLDRRSDQRAAPLLIGVSGSKARRGPQERAAYLVRYQRDFPLAILEPKPVYSNPGDGQQQAKD